MEFGQTLAWEIFRFKLSRLIYEEIVRLKQYPNFKSSKVLGFVLNVTSLSYPEKRDGCVHFCALSKWTIYFTKINFLTIFKKNYRVAQDCLVEQITFEKKPIPRLVKTYFIGLNSEPPKTYLNLIDDNNFFESNVKTE